MYNIITIHFLIRHWPKKSTAPFPIFLIVKIIVFVEELLPQSIGYLNSMAKGLTLQPTITNHEYEFDLDEITTLDISTVNSVTANNPLKNYGLAFTFAVPFSDQRIGTFAMQFVYGLRGVAFYYRIRWSKWEPWRQVDAK